MNKDIHDYPRGLQEIIKHIQQSTLSEQDKKLLLEFDRAMLVLEHLSFPRRIKLLGTMFVLAKRDFTHGLRSVTSEDVKRFVADLETRQLSPWTAAGYKTVLRKFYKWLAYGDLEAQTNKYPPLVAWLRTNVKKKDRPRILASQILTEEEIQRLIQAADRPRDRAFISILYETGCRISEIGGLSIGDVSRDQYSYLLDLSGKTGHRTPRIVLSDPALTEWLNHHPARDDPEAPLWISLEGKEKGQRLSYSSLRKLVQRLGARAGITKRLYPHLFRHTRATHLLMRREMTESLVKTYMGWTADSKELSTYSHLVSRNANDAILELNGITPQEQTKRTETRPCPRCRRVNDPTARFCVSCSSPMDAAVAAQIDNRTDAQNELLNYLLADPGIKQSVLLKLGQLDTPALTRAFKALTENTAVYKA